MTQVEFENQLRELKNQKSAALAPIHQMLGGVKEKISAINRQIKDLMARREELNQQKILISNQLQEMYKQWQTKINEFTSENYTETRTLENISEWSLVKELNKRGYTGVLTNTEKDGEFLDTLNKKLNGNWSEGESQAVAE